MATSFRTGQTVRLRRDPMNRTAATGEYKVIRQLPESGGETQYRIKSLLEPHERVVKGSSLERV
ncbi:MAG: hypothetical protein HQ495_10420 [Alphaproteobacteria bacterium]|nr:hypothetical protein [Pseudomonadota bacterium]MDA1057547.1 hypothetical protein [Pseudomonadota bacterium]NQV80958.1 hypothetical protein [Alphaproteobacteria bacterium]